MSMQGYLREDGRKGIRNVIVNGSVIFEDGQETGACPGEFLVNTRAKALQGAA